MAYGDARSTTERLTAAVVTGLITTGVGLALLSNLTITQKIRDEALKAFNVEPIKPPPPMATVTPSPKPATPEPEGPAAPPAPKQQQTPVVVPKPKRLVPPRPVPIKVSDKPGNGDAPKSGAAEAPGTGSGAGGQGAGTGSGASGSGTGGGGGIATNAQKLGGTINNSDIPPATITSEGERHVVSVRFRVMPNGRVTNCSVTKPSAIPTLNALTCRLVEQRFVFMPAKNGAGQPVVSVADHSQTYWLGKK